MSEILGHGVIWVGYYVFGAAGPFCVNQTRWK
jgi:hypothetical protein